MTYEDLVAMSQRAVSAVPGSKMSMLDVVGLLMRHDETNRAIAAETLARFMAEFIEYDRPKKVTH